MAESLMFQFAQSSTDVKLDCPLNYTGLWCGPGKSTQNLSAEDIAPSKEAEKPK